MTKTSTCFSPVTIWDYRNHPWGENEEADREMCLNAMRTGYPVRRMVFSDEIDALCGLAGRNWKTYSFVLLDVLLLADEAGCLGECIDEIVKMELPLDAIDLGTGEVYTENDLIQSLCSKAFEK